MITKITHHFDGKLPSGETSGDLVMAPLISNNTVPKVVDVGARSGMFELPESFTKKSDFFGFEPNFVEYEKLVNKKTDSMLAGGVQPKFKSMKYFPTAIWSTECERELNITVGPGACSLSGDANEKITKKMFLEGRTKYTYQESVQAVKSRMKVPCASLDSIFNRETILDYLKVDTEGCELEVFKGAEKLLSNQSILFIKTEFLFTPYYTPHVLLGHQQVYLDNMGYRLIDIDLKHLKYLREPSLIPKSMDRRPMYAGDAFFMIDPDLNDIDPFKKHRLGIVLLVFGYRSLAISMLKEAAILSYQDIARLEIQLSKVPIYKQLKEGWMNFPYRVWPFLKQLGILRT
jgi:FkbM family methyltransferase